MGLDQYRRKRRFAHTPEPAGAVAPAASGGRFVINRHSARRLHYDLRLEMEGVLRSWAVPKGPTLDPQQKRVAILVEDHPLEYLEFDGTIPEGNYGAGGMAIWDRGTYEWLTTKTPTEQWEKGDLKLRFHGQKLLGEFALVRLKNSRKNEWLLIKKKDFASQEGWDAEAQPAALGGQGSDDPALLPGAVAAPMPQQLEPMLATLGMSLPEGAEWLHEVKWDGIRALCFLHQGRMRLVSRNGTALDRQFPDIAELAQHISAGSAVLDGEIVAFDDLGRPSFGLLQPRIMAARDAGRLATSQPATLFLFDLLHLNGYDLRPAPLIERKRLLAGILRPAERLRLSDHFQNRGRELLDAAKASGLEGVVAKRALSRYAAGRSADWVKVKVVSQQEFVICGFQVLERKPFGSLVLGSYGKGKLAYVGNVGSGLTDELVRQLYRQLRPLAAEEAPFEASPELKQVTWVRPELVCTVRYTSWTQEQRLRAPVFIGMRPDIAASDLVRESVAEAPPPSPPSSSRQPLLAGKQAEVVLDLDGRHLKFTNLNKVFWPAEGYRKRDLINYYDAVAPLLVPHLSGRPLSLKRYPNGIAGEFFFQKQAAASFPEWLRLEAVWSEEKQAHINFVVCDDRATLLYLANLACIDQNPAMSRVGSLEHPDFILIDLDPVDCAYDRIVEAAQLVRQKLEALELNGYPKTTGGDGMHIYVPLEPRYSFEQARSFAEIISRLCVAERPDLFTTPRTVSRREKGKVYFDYLQIASIKTISAPYVLRAHAGAPVATPLRWNEVVRGLVPQQFHLANVLDRFERLGDVFEPVLTKPQRLEPALAKLENIVGSNRGA